MLMSVCNIKSATIIFATLLIHGNGRGNGRIKKVNDLLNFLLINDLIKMNHPTLETFISSLLNNNP